MSIFKRTFSQDLDLLEQHLTKDIISQTDCKTILTKLRTTFENAFNSEFKERMEKYTRFDAQSFKDAMIYNMDSIGKYMLEIILHQQRTPQLLKQKKLMQTQEDHSNPVPALNINSLKVDLVVIQNTCYEKKDTNSEIASSKSVKESSLDSATKDVHAIKYKCFVEYTGIEVKHFRDTLLQHMGNFKKSAAERTRHQRWYDSRVNKRQMQMQESKIDTGKAVDAGLVVTKSSGTKSEVQDNSSRSGNDTNADDAYIRPIYDEEPMAERFKPRFIMSTEIPSADTIIMTSMIELESLFGPFFDKYFNGDNQVVSKSFVVTTADASDKRQQQLDSASSTSALATTVTADGNFDL
nr:hypothetical protein [Tanacetum cinerariifolium]